MNDAAHRLSWLVLRQLNGPEWGSGPDWDGSWSGLNATVSELWDEHGDAGVRAAEAYMARTGEADAYAVVAWMTAGAFKGLFGTLAEFCEDQFKDAIDDHFERWAGRVDVGFPVEVVMSEVLGDGGWEFIAGAVEEDDVFVVVDGDEGVYVFDAPNGIDEYRRGGPAARLGVCQWFVLCDRPAVRLLDHPAFVAGVPTCQRCADKVTRLGG